MTDAIVIVLTLAIAALVLWLPVWMVKSWQRKPALSLSDNQWELRPIDVTTIHDPYRVWAQGWSPKEMELAPDPEPFTYVQPHMRAGRPVHGYYRRTKR